MSEPGSNPGLSVSKEGRKAYEEGTCFLTHARLELRILGQLFINKAFFKSEPRQSKVGSEQHICLLWAGGRIQLGTHRKGVKFLSGKAPAGPATVGQHRKPGGAYTVDQNSNNS